MTIFGMPPDDPEGLRPGADDGVLGFGDQGDSLADSEANPAELIDDDDDSVAPEAVRDPSGTGD